MVAGAMHLLAPLVGHGFDSARNQALPGRTAIKYPVVFG
jgi:hypothetical protein